MDTQPANLAETASRLVDELAKSAKRFVYRFNDIEDLPATAEILNADPAIRLAVLRECIDRIAAMRQQLGPPKEMDHRYLDLWRQQGFPRAAMAIITPLLRRTLPWTAEDLAHFAHSIADLEILTTFALPFLPMMISVFERTTKNEPPTDELRTGMERLGLALSWIANAPERKLRDRLARMIQGSVPIYLEPGEAWSDDAIALLQKLKEAPAKAWTELLVECQTGHRGKLTDRWRTKVEPLLAAVGASEFKSTVLRWFPLVDKPRTHPIAHHDSLEPDYNLVQEPHVELLRGLVWCCGFREDAELARALARLALSAYRKIPGKGPRLVSLGNACITALGMMPGMPPIGQLALLKVKVKFGTAQKEIEKAFNAAAERENLPREEIEELAVPSYGLEDVGVLRETFADYRAELIVDGSAASLQWLKDGKPLKSAPASVKKDHTEEFKELQGALKDVNAMLPAQRERIDTLFLAQKTWPLALWKERYLDHPLVGTIARRLIWSFMTRGSVIAGIWHAGRLVGIDDKPLKLSDEVTVSLWHPIGHPIDEIVAWRDWLEQREVIQPFKQAHREVYILTDAERRTATYSNRFAAHILRQHQFHALCAARGWKNKLRLMVDDTYPPAHRLLPSWNLRAEYWVEGAGTEYGRDTNDAGAYHYLVTDQVRYYRSDARQMHAHAGGGGYRPDWNQTAQEPLPLETIPPLVFSEIMRDVDLFVGVASVGNDPNWADGGPTGQYGDYWHGYAFGELSATAETRRALLERLIPRLKIADRCTLADRFLIVKGKLRTYKIHLGSSNILMSPNNQYLCIVPRQAIAGRERVHLPFEGDTTLSVILSKAFLLADDAKITDPNITGQLAP